MKNDVSNLLTNKGWPLFEDLDLEGDENVGRGLTMLFGSASNKPTVSILPQDMEHETLQVSEAVIADEFHSINL